MEGILKKKKGKERILSKYVIFSLSFLFAFFALLTFNAGGVKAASASDATVVANESNYKGNNSGGSYAAYEHDFEMESGTHYIRYFIQGTGISNKDVVKFTIGNLSDITFDRIAVAESGYNMSAGANKNYDTYYYADGAWHHDSTTSKNPGKVATSSVSAGDTTLIANGATTEGNKFDSLFYYDATNNTIEYVYTIRNKDYELYKANSCTATNSEDCSGYGLVNIQIYLYSSESGVAPESEHVTLRVVVSKPVSDFDGTSGFTWIQDEEDATTGCGTNTSPTNSTTTNNICVYYKNHTPKVNTTRDLYIDLPKEVAYNHVISADKDIASIKGNTIYAINSFQNAQSVGSAKWVKYYYHDFNWVSGKDNTNKVDGTSYELVITIDAEGAYIFHIKDLFGNTFKSNTDVEVNDVSKSNILVDYTNADVLTILDASVAFENDDVFGGEIVKLTYKSYDGKVKIMYVNMQKDEATIVLEMFKKILINNGVACDADEDCISEWATQGVTIEPIKKQTLHHDDVAEVSYWKNASNALTNADKPGTVTSVSCETACLQGNSFINNEYNVSGIKNRLEITVEENARYRFYVRDINGNDTESMKDANGDPYLKNPYVDVTVIDRTTPTLTSGGATPTITSYEYVNGGGESNDPNRNVAVDLITNPTSTAIYYVDSGDKYFNYEDAIRIAQLSAKDATTISGYSVDFAGGSLASASGTYTDPSKLLLSERNLSGSVDKLDGQTINLHDYILSNDIKSFTGGMVIPNIRADISSNKFTVNSVEYTINYTNDKPVKLTSTGGDITISNGRTFTISGHDYIISGDRVLSYDADDASNTIKTPVAGLTYTAGAAGTNQYDTYMSLNTATTTYTLVNAFATTYATNYMGFIEIEFYEADVTDFATATAICKVTETASSMDACFGDMNKRIDTVRNFKMRFIVHDYVGHASEALVVTVSVEDNTAPGYTSSSDFYAQGTDESGDALWTNKFSNSSCMLEIGNTIRDKETLINCYLIGASAKLNAGAAQGTYHFKDNDTRYNVNEDQWYNNYEGYVNYYNSIKVEIETDTEGSFSEVTDNESTNVKLNKAREHDIKFTIYDNWDAVAGSKNNSLTITMTYYVNPRTLLIEPLANEKIYGDTVSGTDAKNWDPTFDYCVYINTNINTFDRTDEFFDWDFVEDYFKVAYCTSSSEFAARKTAGTTWSEENLLSNVLVNGNAFTGALSRVESLWYNKNIGTNGKDDTVGSDDTDKVEIQNNYVGYYNIVLGSLAIHPDTATSGAACATAGDSYTCDQDYVIKVNPHFLIGTLDATSGKVQGTNQLGNVTQVQDKSFETNDATHTESKVQLTIKQAILNVAANGGVKKFGEQDDNSSNYATLDTQTNVNSFAGYLNGYTTSGYMYDDANTTGNGIISGVLRREIGENVGIYKICNLANGVQGTHTRANPSVEIGCSATFATDNVAPTDAFANTTGNTYKRANYGIYGDGGEYNTEIAYTPALMIQKNSEIYGTVSGKSLNTDHRNYVISYTSANYLIEANELIVQPGINQGKEYSYNKYHDPIWQIVVYGETVTCSNVTTCTSNIVKNDSAFTGYTADIANNSYTNTTIDTYKNNSGFTDDSDIYYSRRKVSPDVTYNYKINVELALDGSATNGSKSNVYTKSGSVYTVVKLDSISNVKTDGSHYVYAYGAYHAISAAPVSNKVEVTLVGHLVNETYTLFANSTDAPGTAKIYRVGGEEDTNKNHNVGWYAFDSMNNNSTNFKVVGNGKDQCTVAETSISTSGTTECRNYNLTYDVSAPDAYELSDGAITKVTTINGSTSVYKPDGVNECTNASAYTAACTSNTNEVLFEIFKREIVISFDASNYIFVYGHRYDYYDGGNNTINGVDVTVEANKLNGIFKIKDSTSEGDIFVCYSEHHVAVNCTGNDDYGITTGDSWTSIGLEFYMHEDISKTDSIFYDDGSDYAIPAGTYYIYANITDEAKLNYKFTYLGGTLTIIPKVTSIELTSYTMEYKDAGFGDANRNADKYHSYGLGSDYSAFTEYSTKCMLDKEYRDSTSDSLINISGCLTTDNVVGNTYGFTVEGLDDKDTIAQNFKGRPTRATGDNVGYYAISVGTIGTVKYKPSSLVNATTYTGTGYTCAAFSDEAGFSTDCVYVTDSENYNYDITYSLNNNEGANLFITPANITIEVYENQTKMYGCAYSAFNTTSSYTYGIAAGYTTNCNQSAAASDIQYKYKVIGDKDYNSGSEYDVTGDLVDGNTTSSLVGSLYRVAYTTSNITYDSNANDARDVENDSANNVYQGQSVGTYIITLGDLNVKTNGGSMCDAFNNPVLNGGQACSNYNINYYGQSASKGTTSITINDTHKYGEETSVKVSDLQTYDLNYVADNSGAYVLMNGKYILAGQVETYTNHYVAISSLTKYSLNKDYVKDASGTYVHINGKTVVKSGGTEETVSGYVLLSSLEKFGADGNVSASGTYIKVDGKLISVNDVNKYTDKITTASDKYVAYTSGIEYVKINDKYVSLNSLKKYKETSTGSGIFVEDATNGTHVLIYNASSSSGLTKYKLDAANMYVEATDGAYVFINGSYVLKSTVAPNASANADMTIKVKSAVLKTASSELKHYGDSSTATTETKDDVNGDGIAKEILFTITHRDVHVHTEYNVKYIGNNDLTEVITCSQIQSAYGLSSFNLRDGRIDRTSYCASGSTTIDLGVGRYYAVENSLAKFPWTAWVDKANNGAAYANTLKIGESLDADDYRDTQFDVVTGELARLGTGTNDGVGKYSYDYKNIQVVTALSGSNYIIKIATQTDWDNTYVKVSGSYVKLSSLTRYDASKTADPLNGYYVITDDAPSGGVISISAANKYTCTDAAAGSCSLINYWYLGFYQLDDSEGRSEELMKWWKNTSVNTSQSNNDLFSNNYANLIQGKDNSGNTLSSDDYFGIYDPILALGREVYFEIVRRTIYLYAVDASKVYGTPDKYGDFLVAICPTDAGYEIDETTGKIKCRSADYNPETHGLSAEHSGIYYETVGTDKFMKQETIKGATGYTFLGTTGFEIYFKRSAGENVGSYSITACAVQTGISDCTDPSQEESTRTANNHVGDNYRILEVAGTLTINTRKITIDPDSSLDTEVGENQGFMYGNYPNNGQIPSITYKEYYQYVSESNQGSQGMVNSGDSAIASTKASCLIDVSGDAVVCINDNQNASTDFTTYEVLGDYTNATYMNSKDTSNPIKTITGVKSVYETDIGKYKAGTATTYNYQTYKNNVYKDSYTSDASPSESAERKALNRICGATNDLRYSRDVCNYEIVAGELDVDSAWVSTSVDEYVKIVKSNVYTDANGTTLYTVSGNTPYDATGKYLKVGEKFFEIAASNRYTYGYVQTNSGSYLFAGGNYHKIILGTNTFSNNTCTTRDPNGTYFKNGTVDCTQIVESNRYNLSKNNLVVSATGEFLKINVTGHNYTVEKFVEDEQYIVTAATVKMTPVADQYKIYGEADPEIAFTVETTYTVKSEHKASTTNILSIKDGSGNAVTVSGTEMTLQPGYVVTLKGFAYDENMKDGSTGAISTDELNDTLNYGANYSGVKHSDSKASISQTSSGATHFDAYTSYNNTVDVSRILIGNFYVENHDQNVGVRNIMNGFIIAINNLSDETTVRKNYVLDATNTVNTAISGIQFTIIPRPIYVLISDRIKTYGEATDTISCDAGADCTVESDASATGGKLLTSADGKLMYNYSVVSPSVNAIPTTPSGGIAGVYTDSAINISGVTSSARTGYDAITTFTASKYYTADGAIEEKNDDLDIRVERGSYNFWSEAKSTACLVETEGYVAGATNSKGCEDAGTYYTKFVGDNDADAYESTVEDYYHGIYWGYNKNYYVLIENEVDTAVDTALNNANMNPVQTKGATLTINRKEITIIVETFTKAEGATSIRTNASNIYDVTNLGEVYNIEENMDVPVLPTVSNTDTHTTYQSITWELHPSQVRTADKLHGYVAYCQTAVDTSSLPNDAGITSVYELVQKANCTGDLVYHENGTDSGVGSVNNANSGPTVFDTSVAGYYAITRNKDHLYIRYNDGTTMTASGASGNYEANNYTTTFVNGVLAIDEDETAPVIYAGSEYYTIEANAGVLAGINDLSEDGTYDYLNSFKTNECSYITGIKDVTPAGSSCVASVFTTAIPVANDKTFKLNGYKYLIDGTQLRNQTNTSASPITITSDAFTISSATYHIVKDGSNNPIFIVKDVKSGVTNVEFTNILNWFNIKSHDPSILRNNAPVEKRYDARYYIAIDAHFNQRVVGSYTLYIYALDVAGNVSRATTVTLNVKDETAPEVGYLNLYEGKIECDFTTTDCVSEGADFGNEHITWSNNANGIYLSVTGGKDNALTYLDISSRIKYNKADDLSTITDTGVNGNGAYILNGNIVKLQNMTLYVKQDSYYFVKNPNENATGEIYIRVNGEYKKLSEMSIYSLSSSVYTKIDYDTFFASQKTDNYYIVIGDFYEIPTYKYNVASNVIKRNDTSGTYIKLNQWDHYFSRDNGETWIKYDLEAFNGNKMEGYSALNTDGQRLIMIKAVDNGYAYTESDSTNTVNGTAKTYFSASYFDKKNNNWYSPSTYVVTGTFKEWKTGAIAYHVSDWANTVETSAGDYHNGYFRDRRYAYLDTQRPMLNLDSNSLWVYEYGCANCTTGYTEEYGETIDYYLLDLTKFNKLNDASGDYINLPQEDAQGKDLADFKLYLADRVYAKNEGTAQNACTGKWINGVCYTKSSSGQFVYVGTNKDEVAHTVNTTITTQIFNAVKGTTVAFKMSGNVTIESDGSKKDDASSITDTSITVGSTAQTTEQLDKNTLYTVSGVSGSNLMAGSQFTSKTLETLDHNHKRMTIYLTVDLPYADITTNTNTLTGGIFGNNTNAVKTYYKYNLVCTGAEGGETCTVNGYYSTTSNSDISTSIPSMSISTSGKTYTEVINEIVAKTLTASNNTYQGRDLTYSVNYTTTDMSGNVSETQVRGVIFSYFLETLTLQLGNGAAAVNLFNNYAIDVDQNTNVLSVLGDYKLTTTKSADNPLLDNKIIQTIYYNDMLISSEETFKRSTLENLDTSVPGVYRIVYSTKRLDGDNTVYGSPLELTINVKPNVANVTNGNIEFKQIAIISIIGLSTVLAGVYVFLASKKRRA